MQVLAAEAAQLVRLCPELVALYRCRAILLRPLVILQVQLGQRTQEIRLCEVRLGLDGLVEILYGEHIVLHRQDIPADVDHLLGVDLCGGSQRRCRHRRCHYRPE